MKGSMILLLTKSRMVKWAGHVPRHGEERRAHSVLVGKLEEKRQIGRHRLRLENNRNKT